MSAGDFRAITFPARLYSGLNALDKLPAEADRAGAKRAFVVCGRTVSRETPLVDRIAALLGERYAGRYDELAKNTSLASVREATAAARASRADLLIGVGAGSVLQGVRVVAILLAETEPIEKLITQYPDRGPAISPKLRAPKLPIVNVLTAPTTAQNRAGSGVHDPALDHRMEFFDPKTRPRAVFWDAEALLTAPPSMMRASAAAIYWRAAMNLAALDLPPLCEGDRLQAWRLCERALPRIIDAGDWEARVDLCAAAWLHNREADVGGSGVKKTWVARSVYAFATALINRHAGIGQGQAYAAMTPAVMRALGARELEAHAQLARSMGVWNGAGAVDRVPEFVATGLEKVFAGLGMATHLSVLGFPKADLATVLEHSLKNFNADPGREFVRERAALEAALAAAW